MTPETLTTSEAALHCGVARSTIHSWIQRGKLYADKRGRDYMIDADELERCNEQRKYNQSRKDSSHV